MERVTKYFPATVKAYNKDDLTVDHFISTEEEDRSGDTVYADGIEFDAQPMVLKNHGMDHDTGSEPIARCDSYRVATVDGRKGVLVRTRYYDGTHLTPPDNTGRRLFEKAIGGFMPFWSIGFGIKDSEPKAGGRGRHLRNTVVYEYSQVGVPDNPTADVLKGFTVEQAEKVSPESRLVFAAVPPAPQEPPAPAPEEKKGGAEARETKPKPRDGETRDEYLQRCIPMLVEEGKPQDQAVAVCNAMWEERDKGKAAESEERKSFSQSIAGRVGLAALQMGHEAFLGELLYATPDEKSLKALLKEYSAYVETHARAAWAEIQALLATPEGKELSREELKARILGTTSAAPQSSAAATPGGAVGDPAAAAPPPLKAAPQSPPVVLTLREEQKQEPQLLPFSREQVAQVVRNEVRDSTRREVRRMLGRVD